MAQTTVSEMVGATEAPVTLARERSTAHIAIAEPKGPAARATGAMEQRRVYLNLENITSSGVPSSYAIYLNLPDGADPEQNRHLFAGLLPAFGVAEASRKDEHNAGSGLNRAIDVTDIVEWLQANNRWDPAHLHVTFVPRGTNPGEVPVQVGRTSLYYK
jgi:tyrosinase